MMKLLVFFLFLACPVLSLTAQVSINTNGDPPDNSAMLDVSSTARGLLMPRMTQRQIELISEPADGLVVYCTTTHRVYLFVGTTGLWTELAIGTVTITPWSCGLNMIITHTAGDVAPVTKTVTYETVTNIPGETSKCWIASNLGADHKATAVNDASEASAGWYWQFNRKQGYKHDGTTRTPNTTWIINISEASGWLAENDPCTIELGSGWRIPTWDEWNNVVSTGAWSDWLDPFGSGLILHPAGYLYDSNGSLYNRGGIGIYWSSTQYDTETWGGWALWFRFDFCDILGEPKSEGASLRCIKQ